MNQQTPILNIQVVTWNSALVIADFLRSLKAQEFSDYALTVVDNASSDNTLQIVEEINPAATIIRNDINRGFCAAHNQAIKSSTSPYIAIVNPDLVLLPDSLSIILSTLQSMPDVGCMGGKLLKTEPNSGMIDSAGIAALRFRRFVNRGEGMPDLEEYSKSQEVFAIPGAFMILRREALNSIALQGEYLDEDIFAYKDEIDLAWRLRLAGWKLWYEARCRVFHKRTAKHETEYSVRERRKRKSVLVNRLSYRNHILVLAKNDDFREWLNPLRSPVLYELAKLFYILIFEWPTLPAVIEAIRMLPRMLLKRRQMQRLPDRVAAVNQWLQ